ncbi:hypothetical protein L6R52_19225 [Myxococcota bacterium]|nr:hypothetical protein [Myxococcota bacterium]
MTDEALPARDSYVNPVARSYAEQGRVAFAELLEAGHACAACHLTHPLNRIPTDGEIDLDRYLTVSLLTRGGRVAVEAAVSAQLQGAYALEAKIPTMAYRIRVVDANGPLDGVTLRHIGERILESPVARRSYAQLQKHGTEVIFDFGTPPNGYMAIADRARNEVRVFVQAHRSPQEVVSSLVHEASHIQRYYRGANASQLDELRAFSREFLCEHGRRPKREEREALRKLVKSIYDHLPEE